MSNKNTVIKGREAARVLEERTDDNGVRWVRTMRHPWWNIRKTSKPYGFASRAIRESLRKSGARQFSLGDLLNIARRTRTEYKSLRYALWGLEERREIRRLKEPGTYKVLKLAAMFIVLCVTMAPAVADTATVLDRIAQVESRGDHRAVGDGGRARGAWQMHRAAWDDVTRRRAKEGLPTWPHGKAHDPAIARIYAQDHLAWLAANYRSKTGETPTPQELYALWNLGPKGFARRSHQLANTPRITRRAAARI